MRRVARCLAGPRRSILYVPASSEKMVRKASSIGADAICLDLEDGVSLTAKEAARSRMLSALGVDYGRSELMVRVNPVDTALGRADVAALRTAASLPATVVLPKVDSPAALQYVASELPQLELIAIIESAKALLDLDAICSATPQLTGLIFGGDDYAADVMAIRTESNSELWFARNMMLLHAAKHKLQAIDIVNISYKDGTQAVEAEALQAFQMGFCGKQCIHPSQVEVCHRAFAPQQQAIDHAIAMLRDAEAHAAAGVGAFEFRGQMIDAPTIKQAENLVARARACGLLHGERDGTVE